MITKEEVRKLLQSTETYRIERTTSTGDMDKFQEAICAFANDLPNSRKKGYLILGAHDNGTLSGVKVTDALLKKIAAIRSDGNILPLPIMSVERFEYEDGDLLVAEVSPSLVPPVRYRGRTFVRIGPRRDIATESEERILFERRTSYMATFDATPCFGATLKDIDTDYIKREYLTQIIDSEVLESDTRGIKEQLASIHLYDLHDKVEEFSGQKTGVANTAGTVLVVKASAGSVDDIKAALENYKNGLVSVSENYQNDFPEAYQQVSDGRVVAKGDYAVLAIAAAGVDYTEVDAAIDEALK